MTHFFSKKNYRLIAMLAAVFTTCTLLQAKEHEEPKITTLALELPRLELLTKEIRDPSTLKKVNEVIKYAEKVVRAGKRASPEAVTRAVNATKRAIVYLKQKTKKGHHSSSSSECDACEQLSELESEIHECCKDIKGRLYDLLRLLHKDFPCDAETPIGCVPYVINKPGKYCVTQDLSYSGNKAAITVMANNVTINFHNHSLTLSNPAAQGVRVENVSEFTLLNDIIQSSVALPTATNAAIHLENVHKATIDNVYTYNTLHGIKVIGCNDVLVEHSFLASNQSSTTTGSGILVEDSKAVTVDSCTFEGDNLSLGFFVFGDSQNITVLNSTLSNWRIALDVDQVAGMLIEDCLVVASPLSTDNIALFGNTGESQMANDIIVRNSAFIQHTVVPGFDGLVFSHGKNCLLENVIVDTTTLDDNGYLPAAVHVGCSTNSGCAEDTLSYDNILAKNCIVRGRNLLGLYVEKGANVIFTHSQFSDAASANIKLGNGAYGCVIKESTISDAAYGFGGMGVAIDAYAEGNAVVNCEINNNAGAGIYLQTNANQNHISGNHIYGNDVGINNGDISTETYFNISCDNVSVDCTGVLTAQAPSDMPIIAGSNICCDYPNP